MILFDKYAKRIVELDAIIRKAYEDQGYGPIKVVFYHCKKGFFFKKTVPLHGEKGKNNVEVTFKTEPWGKNSVQVYYDCNDLLSETWRKCGQATNAIIEELEQHGYTNVRNESMFDENVVVARFA